MSKQRRYYDPGSRPMPRRIEKSQKVDEFGVPMNLHVEVPKMTRQLRRQMQRQIEREGK